MLSQKIPDAGGIEDHERQYGDGPGRPTSEEDLDRKFPGRPRNHSKTLPFHDLYLSLFEPLLDNKRGQNAGNPISRKKQGPHGPAKLSPTEIRTRTIQQFISRWRTEVGDDFYPALRLIVPEKDRDRPMYGLKERAIAKLLIKIVNIGNKTTDALNLLNWKLPGQATASGGAGDFPARCHEVLKKRALRNAVGDMRIAEVNELLDKLAAAGKEEDQLPIFKVFYERMNADELTWLIRIILRRLNMGATERTFFGNWHPDADKLFNVSSSLRRVCWELFDPTIRLEDDSSGSGIAIMSCFQPQLAQFQMYSFDKAVTKLGVTKEDPEFWIEEKLDGERIQMHMMEDDRWPGGTKFAFWSRKAKDYTYLYGNGFEDNTSALTRHIKEAFDPNVRNIILDGEMITWDPEADMMVPFGTLKTAALSEQRDPYAGNGIRPLFKVFDCVYLNDTDLTRYTLRDRRNALESAVHNVHRRIELHERTLTDRASDIEPRLREVVAGGREGLVLKNPRSTYQLNSRVDDWIKIKPEYMSEFGENLDCLIIGGYYGSGRRGGRLSSFMCGLRVDQNDIKAGANPMKFFSFFKVGGGFTALDYANIKEKTDGKWQDWDRKHPPTEYIDTGRGEVPDVWIMPEDSVVVEVKAAQVVDSDSFSTKYSLRFPRFRKLRTDKSWETALSAQEFARVKAEAETELKEKTMTFEGNRKRSKRLKGEQRIAGNDSKIKTPYAGPKTHAFQGLSFCVLTDMLQPQKKSKAELEQIIKSNGGTVFQNATGSVVPQDILCIAEKRLVKVASLIKSGEKSIIRPVWIVDALKQIEADGPQRQRLLVPFEPAHMFHATDEAMRNFQQHVDEYGDSYARDVRADELKTTLEYMIHPKNCIFSANNFFTQMEEHGNHGFGEQPGSIFRGQVVRFTPESTADSNSELEVRIVKFQFAFACGVVAEDDDDENITHFVVVDEKKVDIKELRAMIAGSSRTKFPRIVSFAWLRDSWAEKTLLPEEQYAVF